MRTSSSARVKKKKAKENHATNKPNANKRRAIFFIFLAMFISNILKQKWFMKILSSNLARIFLSLNIIWDHYRQQRNQRLTGSIGGCSSEQTVIPHAKNEGEIRKYVENFAIIGKGGADIPNI